MPQAPALPPGLQSAGATGGIDPQNFLLAAADLHQQGALSSPVPRGKSLPAAMPRRPSKRPLKVVK